MRENPSIKTLARIGVLSLSIALTGGLIKEHVSPCQDGCESLWQRLSEGLDFVAQASARVGVSTSLRGGSWASGLVSWSPSPDTGLAESELIITAAAGNGAAWSGSEGIETDLSDCLSLVHLRMERSDGGPILRLANQVVVVVADRPRLEPAQEPRLLPRLAITAQPECPKRGRRQTT